MLFFLIFSLSFLAGLFIPVWWSAMPIAFIAAFFLSTRGRTAFWSAFWANALLWAGWILIRTIGNDNLLAGRMAGLFHLPHWSLLFLLSILIGGSVCGLSAFSGYLFSNIYKSFNYVRKRDQ